MMKPPLKRSDAGFTLIEFMIAITLSLIVMAALSALLVSSSRSRDELQKANEQVENGRYAMQLLTDDIQLAGYLSELNQRNTTNFQTPPPLASKPNPCLFSLADLQTGLPLSLQGHDNENNNGSAAPACLGAIKTGTDVVVIRRVSTCVRGTANCTTITGAPYFQASLCDTELTVANGAYRLDSTIGNLDRTRRNCTTAADMRRYLTHIYFIDNNNVGTDGIPTLKRAELSTTNASGTLNQALGFYIRPLVEGIENMQLEYGIDDDTDGIPDNYTSDPDRYAGCTGPADPCSPANWLNVMTVKLNLLARSTQSSPNYSDNKTYHLGLKHNNTSGITDTANNVGPFADSFKRHVFRNVIMLNNPIGNRR